MASGLTGDRRTGLAINACKMYFEQNLPMRAVATKLEISASTVSRLIEWARASGLVRVSVQLALDDSLAQQLEKRLAREFGITCVLVSGHSTVDIGRASARYFEENAKDECTVVLDGGRTISAMVENLRFGTYRKLTLVPFCGDPVTDPWSADEVVTHMALKCPVGVTRKKLPQRVAGPVVEDVLKDARRAAQKAHFVFLAVASFETQEDGVAFPWIPHLGFDVADVMAGSKAVAICGNYGITADGRRASLGEIEKQMTWALAFDELAEMSGRGKCRVVLVAAGAKKRKPLMCVLRARLCNTLFLDELLAAALFKSLEQTTGSWPTRCR